MTYDQFVSECDNWYDAIINGDDWDRQKNEDLFDIRCALESAAKFHAAGAFNEDFTDVMNQVRLLSDNRQTTPDIEARKTVWVSLHGTPAWEDIDPFFLRHPSFAYRPFGYRTLFNILLKFCDYHTEGEILDELAHEGSLKSVANFAAQSIRWRTIDKLRRLRRWVSMKRLPFTYTELENVDNECPF